MPYTKANGIDIYYEVLGEGRPGTPLVMTHGFAGPFRQWVPELEPLAEKRPLVDRTTAPPDRNDYSVPTFAADLAALLRAIGIERAHIGGVSMGGIITAQFAVDYPEMCASVLICDSTCGNGVGDGAAADWERRMQMGITTLSQMVEKYGLRETLLKEWDWKKENDRHLGVSPYTLDGDLERIKLMTVEGYLGAAHAILTRPDLTDRFKVITAPSLVMIGEWDDFLPCALRDHELIPRSRLVVRERCGHGSRWRLDTFISEIESFLADVEAGRPVAGERRV
jgi:pimeloyl-ACP methyl ester carboxylesterase